MTTIAEFAELLRDRLSVDDSYLPDITASVERYVRKLLRDYNFPKSVRTEIYTGLTAGQQSYTLPADTKKPLMVLFRDTADVAAPQYGAPLLRRGGFTLPASDRIARHFWLQGEELWTDISIPTGAPSTELILMYQSNSYAYNIDWMLADFNDILFSLAMFRLASELGKPELTQVWTAMWVEDQRGLAIYINELEFDGLELLMKEAAPSRAERYPAQ